jgi:hypothetical protein
MDSGIANRHPYVKGGQVLSEYFKHGQWQLTLLELVYFIATTTAFPNFLIISMYPSRHAGYASFNSSKSTSTRRSPRRKSSTF